MSRRPRRARVKDALGWVILASVLLGLMALGGAAIALRAPAIDEATLCRKDAPLAGHTIVLVDVSERFETRHRKLLRAVIDQERARLNPNDRLTLRTLNAANPREPETLFSLCDPGDGRSVNPLWGNPARAQARWAEAFGAPLEAAEKAAERAGAQADSPILESFAAAARDPDFSPAVARRRLVLVSDLMELRRGYFSLYAMDANLEGYRGSGLDPVIAPNLAGVAVRMVVLDRAETETRQIAARERFWAPWLAETKSRVSWEP